MFNSSNIVFLIPILALSIPIVAIIAGAIKDVAKHRHNNEQSSSLNSAERERLNKLMETAESMAERIATLESILDAEVPDWRDDHDRN